MKTALITGGTKGIGKAIAFAFLQRGYEVVLNYDSDEPAALAAQEEFNIMGYCPLLLRADVSDERQVAEMLGEFFSIYGRLDVLVNNAGISRVNIIQNTTAEEWDKIFGVNIRGAFLCCREAVDKMIGRGGSIINIASIWGEVGASCEVAYSASKGALIAFTKALAKELAPSKIRVNCVSPGVINTEMNSHLSSAEMDDLVDRIPLGRLGRPEDVADACVFLAETPYVTGEILSVGGGFAK